MIKNKTIILNKDNAAVNMNGALYIKDDFCKVLLNSSDISYDIVIPNEINGTKVSKIRDDAFQDLECIKTVKLPDSINIIGTNAFRNDINLTAIYGLKDVEQIERNAVDNTFYYKNTFKKDELYILGKSLLYIPTEFNDFEIPDGVKYINTSFNGNENSQNNSLVIIPRTVKYLDSFAFYGVYNLDILYKGTVDEMNNVFKDFRNLNSPNEAYAYARFEEVKPQNVHWYSVYDIDIFIHSFVNNNDKNIKCPEISYEAQKKYLLNEIDKNIKNIPDLNKKLRLLTLRDDVEQNCTNLPLSEIER